MKTCMIGRFCLFFAGASLLLATGCATTASPSGLVNVPCTYHFQGLTRVEDQQRVDAAIHAAASGVVKKSGPNDAPEYRFPIFHLADLDTLNAEIMYRQREGLFNSREQTLNMREPRFEIKLDSADAVASLAMSVTFKVVPGSRLYIKDELGHEKDVTDRVNAKGQVTLSAHVGPGQENVYARVMRDRVVRYIRINVSSRQVSDATRREYENE